MFKTKIKTLTFLNYNNNEKEVLALFQNQEAQQYKINSFEIFGNRRSVYNKILKLLNNKHLAHVKEQLKTSIKYTLF